jgi:predicted phosphohydrolase
MKAAWFTDIHLDCVDDPVQHVENMALQARYTDTVLITGDISISNKLVMHLSLLEDIFEKPVFFILGNHDFYFSDISTVRNNVSGACNSLNFCRYLSSIPFIRLAKGVTLVGHDGWYDAGNGDLNLSALIMNDWLRIADYRPALLPINGGVQIAKYKIAEIARQICASSVKHVVEGIKCAIQEKSEKVVVMTHVPPFVESFVFNPNKGMRVIDALPWYTSKMMGDMLYRAAKSCPQIQFTVLSGHTHAAFDEKILDNLVVKVGSSEYGSPSLAGILNI